MLLKEIYMGNTGIVFKKPRHVVTIRKKTPAISIEFYMS